MVAHRPFLTVALHVLTFAWLSAGCSDSGTEELVGSGGNPGIGGTPSDGSGGSLVQRVICVEDSDCPTDRPACDRASDQPTGECTMSTGDGDGDAPATGGMTGDGDSGSGATGGMMGDGDASGGMTGDGDGDATPSGPNLIDNGDFSSGTTGWEGGDGAPTVEDGKGCRNGGTFGWSGSGTGVTVPAGSYTFSFKASGEDVDNLTVKLAGAVEPWEPVLLEEQVQGLSSTLMEHSFQVDVASEAETIGIAFLTSGGYSCIDDVSLAAN